MELRTLREEKGQAAVFITILLMFALIALTALAIDGGHLYVVRRDLQNMADAACLAAATEFALGGDEAGAYQTAVDYILANGGREELYTPQETDAEGLSKGIQVSGKNVRVALQTVVDTYFTMIFDRTGAGVGARAHCNATAGGGLLPIAIRRYQYNEEDQRLQLDLLANKNCQPNPADPSSGCYYHNPATGDPNYYGETWYGKDGEEIEVWLPVNVPTTGWLTDTTTGNIDCDVPPPDDPPAHVGACVLGDGVSTNDGTADYKGFVLLDVRNIEPGPVEYLSGATGQSNTNKDISQRWLCEGYENTPPMVGEQLAMLDGVSNDFAAQEMSLCWDEGEIFVAVVYSGYIWTIPDLEMRIEPDLNPDPPTFPSAGDPVTYTVILEKTGNTPWEKDGQFSLAWNFMENAPAYHEITPTVEFGHNPLILPVASTSVTTTMTVYATNPLTTTDYLSALTVRAWEYSGIGLRRWGSTNFRYGNVGAADFTVYARQREINVPQDGSVDIYLITTGFGGIDERNVPVSAQIISGPTGNWGEVFTSSPNDTIRRIRDVLESRFTLRVTSDAPASEAGMPYTVRFTVGPAEGQTHTVDVTLNVHTPRPGGTPSKFVIVQGFAPFQVSYKDANTIGAFAVGPIVDDPTKVTAGMQARLLPW